MAATSDKEKKTKNPNNKKVQYRKTAATYALVKNIFRWSQGILILYAFINLLFWLGTVIGVFKQGFLFYFFLPAWKMVSVFYKFDANSTKNDVDFTGFILTVIIAVASIILKSIADYIADLEEAAKIKDAQRQERALKKMIAMESGKRRVSKEDAQAMLNREFIFLLEVEIETLSSFVQRTPVSPEEIIKIKSNIYNSILNNLNLNQVSQKGYFKKKLFLVYKNFSYFDDLILYVRDTLSSLLQEFTKPNLRVNFKIGLTELQSKDALKVRLDTLDTVCQLGLGNEFLCTASLKEIYEITPKPKFEFRSKGVYNLSKNLNVSNNEEIFSIEIPT